MESILDLDCAVCSKPDSKCLTHLGPPICPSCWNDPGPLFRKFVYDLEIDKITSKIFLGNEEAQKRKALLKALGITNILIVAEELRINFKDDFIYKKIDVQDTPWQNIAKFFDETFDFIEEAKGNVYVHCAAGISRSASVVIAYLMRKEGKNFEETLEFVQEKRYVVDPNNGFKKQLKGYEEKIKLGKNNIDQEK